MALVRSIIINALVELGIVRPGATVDAALMATGLDRIQSMIDAWGANRLTLSLQLRTQFTMSSGDSSIQIGPGAAVNIGRPVWINSITYINPGSSPEQETLIGQMDDDGFAALSIKELSSALPLQSFYQTNLSDALGTLFLWPQVNQDVDIVIYTPQAVAVPATLDVDLIGPPGYRDAFMYGLALRLMTPLAVAAESVPLLVGPDGLAARAWTTMTRPNIAPGVLGIDAALVPNSGAGYNVLSDVMQSSR